jgi:hypothetical protein
MWPDIEEEALYLEAVLGHPVVVEDLGEVTPARVGEDDHDQR